MPFALDEINIIYHAIEKQTINIKSINSFTIQWCIPDKKCNFVFVMIKYILMAKKTKKATIVADQINKMISRG